MIYLDYNATTPVASAVVEAMHPFWTEDFANPASEHRAAAGPRSALDRAAEHVGGLVGASPSSVVWTSGATEANNIVLRGAAEGALDPSRRRIVVTAGDHKASLEPVRALAARGHPVGIAPLAADGRVDLDALAALLDDDVLLVSAIGASNETGALNPVAELTALAHEHGAYLHLDLAQWVGKLPIDLGHAGVDAASLSAHKLYGPKGVGALVVSPSLRRAIAPLHHGGGHQGGLRPGTLDVPSIVGFGEAARLAADHQDERVHRLRQLRDLLLESIQQRVPDVEVNGPEDEQARLPNTLNLRIRGADAQAVLANCPQLAASTGSACTSAAIEPSHVLEAMGLDREQAEECLRLSVGVPTSEEEVVAAASMLGEAVAFVRGADRDRSEPEVRV